MTFHCMDSIHWIRQLREAKNSIMPISTNFDIFYYNHSPSEIYHQKSECIGISDDLLNRNYHRCLNCWTMRQCSTKVKMRITIHRNGSRRFLFCFCFFFQSMFVVSLLRPSSCVCARVYVCMLSVAVVVQLSFKEFKLWHELSHTPCVLYACRDCLFFCFFFLLYIWNWLI